MAASIVSHCGAGCFPATTTMTQWRLRNQWSVAENRQLD
jgi:hypothetical protein